MEFSIFLANNNGEKSRGKQEKQENPIVMPTIRYTKKWGYKRKPVICSIIIGKLSKSPFVPITHFEWSVALFGNHTAKWISNVSC